MNQGFVMPELIFRLSLDARTLLREHPPRFHHPYKTALFEIAYAGSDPFPATIEVTRWSPRITESIDLSTPFSAEIRPDFYDYQAVADGVSHLEWHVNFADPRLFFAYGSGLFAQDEMQVAEHPLLASVREALCARQFDARTSDKTGPTPVLVENVERRISVATNPDTSAGRRSGLYGNRFAEAPLAAVRNATRILSPPAYSNIIAMAAPAGGHGDYTESEIQYIFTTAHAAFSAAAHETKRNSEASRQSIIHTGFWGCGAFGGNRRLMVLLQALAARASGVRRMILHAGDTAGAGDAERGLDIAENIAARCGSGCTLKEVVERCAMLGYQWGTSDGN
jgi:hypothetical protein